MILSIGEWLENLGFAQYVDTFIANAIDREILPELNDQDLRELGVTALGHRKKLLKAIAALGALPDDMPSVQAVKSPPAHAERRQLTVMFCDLVDYTSLSVRYDPEDLREIITAYQVCCERTIKRFDGHVACYMGDGLLVYFGYPRAHEDDPERAIRAGLEVIHRVGQLDVHPEECLPAQQLRLQTRVGIATGEVVTGALIGERVTQELGAVGETTNLAARLQGIADPDSVVIADSTRHLVSGLFVYEDLGKRQAKGFNQAVHVWKVLGERAIESRFEATRLAAGLTELVGRRQELEALFGFWRDAAAGSGHAVMLSGEAGIGKSRLIQTLREQLADERPVLLRYYCSPYHQNSALHPVIKQLERLAEFEPEDDAVTKLDKLEALLERSGAELLKNASLLATLLSLPGEQRFAPLHLNPQQIKEKTFQTLVNWLMDVARRRPVLMTFEDLHWIDPTTLGFLDRFVAQIAESRILLLVTARAEFIPPWRDHPHVIDLPLRRLPPTQTAAFVAKLTAGKKLPKSLLEQIIAKTDGVPLFIEELTKTVLEAGFLNDTGSAFEIDGPLPALAVPSTLQDSLMARLDRLMPVKEVAQIGAVIGRQFGHELLEKITPLDAVSLAMALRQLIEAELIFSHGDPPQAVYTFKHALVQDAAYSSLLRGRKQALHKRIAYALEQHFPATVETEPELLAHHFAGAELTESALKYWLKAGERAAGRSANAEAVDHFKKGLALLLTLPDSAARDRQELCLQTRLGPALIAAKGYGTAEVESTYRRARVLCQQLGDTTELISALRGQWLFYLLRAQYQAAHNTGHDFYRQAKEQQIPVFLLEAHLALGMVRLFMGKFGESRQHLAQAQALYQPEQQRAQAIRYGNDPEVVCLCYQARTLWFLGYADQALKSVEQGVKLARDLRHPFSIAQALSTMTNLHQARREVESTLRYAKATIEHCQQQGFPYWEALGRILHGWALARQGAGEVSIREIRAGIAAYETTGARLGMTWFFALLAEACSLSGAHSEAQQVTADGLALVSSNHEAYCHAELCRLKGEISILLDPDGGSNEAEHWFSRALEVARAQRARAWELRASLSLARLWQRQNNSIAASALLSSVYTRFEEGFATADLLEARQMLVDIGAMDMDK